jgi:hypothetical protein
LTDPLWDPLGKAREALRSIVADFGTSALSSPQVLENVLRDLLPGSQKQVSLIVAAAGARVTSSLQEHVAQGMDPSSAVRMSSAQLAEQTPFDAAGCRWVTGEFALALGYKIALGNEPDTLVPATRPPTASPAIVPAPLAGGAPLVPADSAVTVLPTNQRGPPPPPGVQAVGRGGRRRGRTIAVSMLAVVVGGGLIIAAAVGAFSTTSHSPSVALRHLLPDDTQSCTTKFASLKFTGLRGQSGAITCSVSSIGGNIWGYQFDNSGAYQASLNAFNKFVGFDRSSASGSCPSSTGGAGRVTWSNRLYPQTTGQLLECLDVVGSSTWATYIWTIPTQSTFLVAQGSPGGTFTALNTWWVNHAGPFKR